MMNKTMRDVSASFVVFLVAMPLCMGIAIASGVPPERGLLTGIIGGIVVGLLSGSPLQVSGPAAGLVTMVFGIVQTHGISALGPIMVLAGILQCATGALRLGQWFRSISPAVVHGMLAGIGVLIVAGQVHVLVDQKPLASGLANIMAAPGAVAGLFPLDGFGGEAALALGLVTIGAMLAWDRFRPSALGSVPGALVGVALATALGAAFAVPVSQVAVPDSLWQSVSLPGDGFVGSMFQLSAIPAALALAFIASTESLLSASAVDRMQDRARTDYDRELMAQGVGNGVSGLLGGLPITGVIVRSSANVQAGAQTRLSAVLHGFLILGAVSLMPGVLRMIPTAALAGVLVVTGCRLVGLRHVRELRHSYGPMPAAIWLATAVGVVSVDLLTGVLLGIALSVFESVRHLRRPGFKMQRTDNGSLTELRLSGRATFLQLPRLLSTVESLPSDRSVSIRTGGLRHVDHTFASALDQLSGRNGAGGRTIQVA